MKKVFLALILSFFFFALLPSSAYAKRILPRAVKSSGGGSSSVGSGGPGVGVKFRGDRLAIDVNFSNLSQASSVSYLFSYNTRGTTQGAQGSVNPSENNTSREIIFGTCSHGVCRYDYGISGAKFVVTLKLNNGRKIIKTFNLKV